MFDVPYGGQTLRKLNAFIKRSPPIGWLFCIASQYLTNIFDLWMSEKNYLTTICFTFAPGIEDTFSSFAYLLVNSEFCALLKVFLSV